MLEQRKVKAKATHTRDGAGAGGHSCGKAEVVLVVMQGFLEDYELGGGWEGAGRGPLSFTAKADLAGR